MPRPVSLLWWRAAAALSTVAIVMLLLLPAARLPSTAVEVPDKLVHTALFLVWGLSCHRSRVGPGHVIVLGSVLAAGTELGQALMAAGRHADLFDAAADLVGVVLGLGLSWAAWRRERES